MVNKILFLSSLLLLSACSRNQVRLIAKNQPPIRELRGYFEIRSDSTYAFYQNGLIYYKYSVGQWSRVSKREISLSSRYQNRLLNYRIEQVLPEQFSTDSIKVEIKIDKFDCDYHKILVNFNDTMFTIQRCKSLNQINLPKNVKHLRVGFTADDTREQYNFKRVLDTLFTPNISVQAKKIDKLTLTVIPNDSLFNYVIFKEQRLKATRCRLDPVRVIQLTQ